MSASASRSTFRAQIAGDATQGRRESSFMPKTVQEQIQLAVEIEDSVNTVVKPFESKFAPSDMRQLALVAHNHMKPAMKEFIDEYSEVLKKFRITGTQTTMRMCKTMWGEDNPDVEYGLTCTSGPLGGDAQIAALMCMEDLGALIFFVDPLSAHPHQADIDSLIRLANCGNVILCPNPTSAMSMIHTLRIALENGQRGMIPSFFETLESPAVDEYKHQQELALTAAIAGKSPARPVLGADPSAYFPSQDDEEEEEEKEEEESGGDDGDDNFDVDEALDRVNSMRVNFAMDSTVIADSYHGGSRGRRASGLSGIRLPEKQKKKKKKGLIKHVAKSFRRLGITD